MISRGSSAYINRWKRLSTLLAAAAIALAIGSIAARGLLAQEEKGAGAVISPEANAKDVGLPVYPDSKPHKDKDEDSPGANLGLWGGGSGFKFAVMKMETGDAPEKVAAFYKKALSKYGEVLDCSKSGAKAEDADSSKMLTCGDDKPESGGWLFKTGSKEKQHVVGIQPNGKGTLYQLVYVEAWGSGKK